MKKLIYKFLFNKKADYEKENFGWNTAAGIINALEAVILLSLVTRYCGINKAGYLSLAFAVGNLLITVGKYGVRYFQVTNFENISFYSYYVLRIATTIIMIFLGLIYIAMGIIFNGYSIYKALVILFICIIYAIESIEDVYWGELQKQGKLAVGAKIFIIRWLVILFVLSLGVKLQFELLYCLIFATVLSSGLFVVCAGIVRRELNYYKIQLNWSEIKYIGANCTVLATGIFLNYYICNAPKYIIDIYMSDKIQAYYGYIAMPVFVVQLFSNFVFQPLIVEISTYWNKGEYDRFTKALFRQYAVILFLTLSCILGAYMLGIKILGGIYGVDLIEYRIELTILMLGSGLLALNGFLNIILTVMNEKKVIFVGYLSCACITLLLFPKSIKAYGIMGAVISYCIVMFILSGYFNLNVWSKIVLKK